MILAGWNCAECLTFNGEERGPRDECRSCGKPRRTLALDIETYLSRMRLMEANLRTTQDASTRMLHEKRALVEENEKLKADLKSEVRVNNALGVEVDGATKSHAELLGESYELTRLLNRALDMLEVVNLDLAGHACRRYGDKPCWLCEDLKRSEALVLELKKRFT
jgi:hypothetical protein